MKRKKWIKWAVLLVLVVIAAVYCFTWPGREINSDAGVMEGSRTLEAKDAGKVVMLLRRPHIPSVAAICDCAPDLRVSLLSDGVEYQLAIRSHDNQGELWCGDERIAVFYIPSWEMNDIVEMFE